MALKACKECEKEVSTSASKCPHCGVRNPTVTGKQILFSFLALLLLMYGCSIAVLSGETQTPIVNWSLYSPEVKARIDKNIQMGNCAGLQREFDSAYENSDLQKARTGERNTNLIGYLDDKMKEIGCY